MTAPTVHQGGMKPRTRILIGVAVLAVAAGVAWLALRPRAADQAVLSGYVEGEALYLAPPVSGLVTNMAVTRGQRVEAGAVLFSVDARSPTAQRDQALAQVTQMQAQITAAEANRAELTAAASAAAANAVDARKDADRYLGLYRALPGAIAPTQVDKTKAAADSATAQYQAARKQVDAATAQIGVSRAALAAAQAAGSDAQARLSLIMSRAPTAARVEEVFYQTGEWAAANQPVVSLLPDAKVKLRFFAPETTLSLYQPGRTVRFDCDGCAKNLVATITYVSPRPEYTPPEIYSRKTRETLVFLIEAQPASPKGLAPGQPVDVFPLKAPVDSRR